MTTQIPEGYKADSQGRLVPVETIKPIDLARDELIEEIFAKSIALNASLAAFRDQTHADIRAFAELSAEKYEVTLGGKKGNLTLTSFDGQRRIQVAVADQLSFDERLQAAKKLIDDCITAWAADSGPELRALVDHAFQVNKAGNIDTARVLTLRRIDIKDPRWIRAMEAISDALQVSSTRSYIRIYKRIGQTDRYAQINLDLANA